MAKILLLEDDKLIAEPTADWLESKRHSVEHCLCVSDARDKMTISEFDLLILDWNLPDGTGLSLLQEFRKDGGITPALMLTAKGDIEDKEACFAAGTDDYLTKPFSLRELTIRVDALLRRPPPIIGSTLSSGDLVLDSAAGTVRRGDQPVKLTPKEFALLEFLLKHQEHVFTHEALLQRVWSSEAEVSPETVVTTIKRLRKKIDLEGEKSIIETVFATGYKLCSR